MPIWQFGGRNLDFEIMTKRIFAAIDVSEAARRTIGAHVESLRGEFLKARVGWTKPEKLHLTLKFLGDADDEQLENFVRAVENTAKNFSPFELRVDGTGVFPSRRNARVLWLGVADEKDCLQKLSDCLEEECARFELPQENRKFKAHLTVARLRQKTDETLIEKHLQANFPSLEPFEASEIVVYASELLPQGSRYTIIAKAKLNDGER